ncbi:transposase zinc-binding domain-containing protein [Ferrovum myxofaciens]|uniref:transposase zinc-binding domain-containing protein n=1 Tax=Ferrovum myxofaciens TaxID=416213 RepID=UPI003B5C86AB
MLLACDGYDKSSWLPHSCGNRHCPHCQSHESQRWIDKQLQKLVPGEYFMVTFTLPAEFRQLAWHHQRELYELIIRNAWATVNTFSQNDKKTAWNHRRGDGVAYPQPPSGFPPARASGDARRGV